MSKLEEMDELKGKAEGQKRTGPKTAKSICERILTAPGSMSAPAPKRNIGSAGSRYSAVLK